MSSYNPPIVITGGTGGTGSSTPDVESVSSTYEAIVATTEYAIGDMVQRNRFFNTTTPATTYTDVWLNITKGTGINTAPPVVNLKPLRESTLTAADLTTIVIKTSEQDASATVTNMGRIADVAAAADGTGNYTLISGIKRLAIGMFDLLARTPALQSGRVPVATEAQWETVEFRLDANSVVVFEKEYNGTTYRQRTWNSVTDAQGVTSYVAGAWA